MKKELSVREASKLSKKCERAIQKAAKLGHLPATKNKRWGRPYWTFKKEDVLQWIKTSKGPQETNARDFTKHMLDELAYKTELLMAKHEGVRETVRSAYWALARELEHTRFALSRARLLKRG